MFVLVELELRIVMLREQAGTSIVPNRALGSCTGGMVLLYCDLLATRTSQVASSLKLP